MGRLENLRKSLAFGICFLLICSVFIPITIGLNIKDSTIHQPSILDRGKTLYVGGSGPNNYTKIQDAVDNASDGNTVYVFDDSSPYNEIIEVRKSGIKLIGENRETTVIDFSSNYYSYNIISVSDSNNILISSFNITGYSQYNGIIGVYIENSNNIIFENNIINKLWGTNEFERAQGVVLVSSYNIFILNNTLNDIDNKGYLGDSDGIYINHNCNNVKVINNTITNVDLNGIWNFGTNIFIENNILNTVSFGITHSGETDVNISNNILKNCDWIGIYIPDSTNGNCYIYRNNVLNCRTGIELYEVWNIFVVNNNIINNEVGIMAYNPRGKGYIIKNNFINNIRQMAGSMFLFRYKIDENYWDDWIGIKYPQLDFLPYIGFTSFLIWFSMWIDWHPAKEPFDINI
jgi:hypothetical protein